MFNLFKETVTMHHLVSNQQNMLVTIDRDGYELGHIDIDDHVLDNTWGNSILIAMLLNYTASIIGDGFKVAVPGELREATKIALRGNVHAITIK